MNSFTTEELISVKTGRTSWQVPRTMASLPERLHEIVSGSKSPAAKTTRVRNIYFLPAHSGFPALVLKEFRLTGVGARLRAMILGSPAQREWRAIRYLRSRNIPVPAAVALGTQSLLHPAPRAYLASVTLPSSATLEEILLHKRPPPVDRRTLATNLGRLIRAMHDSGVYHGDLHVANLLVDEQGELYVLDLHGARLWKKCSRAARTRDLISLAGASLIHGSRIERYRFIKAYTCAEPNVEAAGAGGSAEAAGGYQGVKAARAEPGIEEAGVKSGVKAACTESGIEAACTESGIEARTLLPEIRNWARVLESAARERLFWFLRKFDRRPLRPGRRFQPIFVHELSGMAERSQEARNLADMLGPYPDEILEARGKALHRSNRTAVYQVEIDGKPFIIKRYEKPGDAAQVSRLLRGSGARRGWINYHRLLFRGLKVPHPVLFLEFSALAPFNVSYLVTETVPGSIRLDRFVETADPNVKIRLANRLARAIARMHRLFLRNRDLKAQNILITPSEQVIFIDPDGVASMKDPFLDVMSRDLMRLNVSFVTGRRISLALRIRFLKAYIAHMGFHPGTLRDFWREIVFHTWDKFGRWRQKARASRKRNIL